MQKISQCTVPGESYEYDYCFTLYEGNRLLIERGEIVDLNNLRLFITEPSQRITISMTDVSANVIYDSACDLWDMDEMQRYMKYIHFPPPARVIAQN